MTDHFGDVCREGLILWDHVRAALPRDGAGPSEAQPETKATKKDQAPPSVNVDVLSAIETIEREAASRLDELYRWVFVARSRYRSGRGTVPDALILAPGFRTEMVENSRSAPVPAGKILCELAEGLEGDVFRWVKLMRRAIGLERESRPAGFACPDDGAGMRVAGEIGRIHPALITGALTAKGVSKWGLEAISWESPGVLYCPECHKRYTGEAEWRTLAARILDTKVNRLA